MSKPKQTKPVNKVSEKNERNSHDDKKPTTHGQKRSQFNSDLSLFKGLSASQAIEKADDYIPLDFKI
jgi:hypothetical protein